MPEPAPGKTALQEAEYGFPYHYIPKVERGSVVYSVAMDWAADYLNGIELVRKKVKDLAPRRVCDVGCGDGRLLNELAPEFPDSRFVGVDSSRRAVTLAEAFRRSANVEFHCSPEPDQAPHEGLYDLVTLIEVYEHIPPADGLAFLEHVGRLVRPGGTLLLTVPHRNVPVTPKHYRHFDGATLASELERALEGALVTLSFAGRVRTGFRRLATRLARNRVYCIEPLFQWMLRRDLGVRSVPEATASKVVATVVMASSPSP